jgi:hypothetical protein
MFLGSLGRWYVTPYNHPSYLKPVRKVQGLESPAGNEHLNSALMPMLPPPDLAQPVDNGRKRDSLPPLPNHNSQPEMKVFNFASTPNLKRNSSSASTFRQSTLSVPPTKKRLSSIGVASSHGRLFKVLGDFFLLAGRTEDAAVWYVLRDLYETELFIQI